MRRLIGWGRCSSPTRSRCSGCVRTVSKPYLFWSLGLAFERKADAPSYCKEKKSEGSDGRFREVSAASKAGALPAELHAPRQTNSTRFARGSGHLPRSGTYAVALTRARGIGASCRSPPHAPKQVGIALSGARPTCRSTRSACAPCSRAGRRRWPGRRTRRS